MADEVMVYGIIKEVCSALGVFLNIYQEKRIVNKKTRQIIIDQINIYQTIQHSNAIGDIAQNNLIQIQRFMKSMEEKNFVGPYRDAAMKNLETMNEALLKLLERY